jgi:hypothetical protein
MSKQSLGIHLPQCNKMFQAQEAKKPKSARRKLPTPPPGYMDALNNVVLTAVPSTPRGGGGGGGGAGAADPGGGAFGSEFTAASVGLCTS